MKTAPATPSSTSSRASAPAPILERRTQIEKVCLTPTEQKKLRELADSVDLSISETLRLVALNAKLARVAKTDPALLRHLAWIGNNLT